MCKNRELLYVDSNKDKSEREEKIRGKSKAAWGRLKREAEL